MIRSRFAVSALTGAALLLPLTAPGAQAQTYRSYSAQQVQSVPSYESCMAAQRNRQVAGAVIGGVLGAVIGAEVHDDRQDRDRERQYRGRDRHRDHYGRGSRRGDRHDRRRGRGYHEDGNDGAVLAGAGLGALAGAAISGRSNGCEHLRHAGYGGYDQGGYAYPDTGYQSGGYQGGYDQGYDQRSYRSASGSQGELLGGESYGYDEPAQPYLDQPYQPQAQSGYGSRSYTASASAPRASACRNMQSGNGAVTWMCQGADGVWRPASTY